MLWLLALSWDWNHCSLHEGRTWVPASAAPSVPGTASGPEQALHEFLLNWSRVKHETCRNGRNYNLVKYISEEVVPRDFPGDLVVKNLPSNAGGTGSIPGRELYVLTCPGAAKFEHCNWRACTLQLLRQCALEPVLHNWRNLHVLQLEKTCALQQRNLGAERRHRAAKKKKKEEAVLSLNGA